ncbi:MAG: universal stress protein [Burkholderiales bacterium]|nr:universal stress protein [Burkholderiales bacterium]
MHKLLIPLDGSDNALRAVRYAIGLARSNGPITVHLVSAHEEPEIYGEIAVYVTRERMAELQQKHSEAAFATAEKLLADAGVAFSREIVTGHIAEAIAQSAERAGCDGIVMGTRGMSAIGNLVMGSVANKVVHLARVPVTLVK